jgi:hypothetical protein
LNSRLRYCHFEAAKGVVHEQWPNDLCSGDGFSPGPSSVFDSGDG